MSDLIPGGVPTTVTGLLGAAVMGLVAAVLALWRRIANLQKENRDLSCRLYQSLDAQTQAALAQATADRQAAQEAEMRAAALRDAAYYSQSGKPGKRESD